MMLQVLEQIYEGHLPSFAKPYASDLLEDFEKALTFERKSLEILKKRLHSLIEANEADKWAAPFVEALFQALISNKFNPQADQALIQTLNYFRQLFERDMTLFERNMFDTIFSDVFIDTTIPKSLSIDRATVYEHIKHSFAGLTLQDTIQILADIHIDSYKTAEAISEKDKETVKNKSTYFDIPVSSFQDGLFQLQRALMESKLTASKLTESKMYSPKIIGELAMRIAVEALADDKRLSNHETNSHSDTLLYNYARHGGINNRLKNLQFDMYSKGHYQRNKKSILQCASHLKNKDSVTILGIGMAQDIPLHELVQQFNTVNLVDMDAYSMILAWLQIPSHELREKIHFHVLDITGGKSGEFLEQSYAIIDDSKLPQEAIEKIEKLCETFDFSATERFPELCSSYVISSMTGSQLLWPVQHLLQRYLIKKFDVSIPVLKLSRTEMVKAHLDFLFQCTNPKGRAYYSDNTDIRSFRHDRPVSQLAFFDSKQVDMNIRELFAVTGSSEWLWWINAPRNYDHYLVRAYCLSRLLV